MANFKKTEDCMKQTVKKIKQSRAYLDIPRGHGKSTLNKQKLCEKIEEFYKVKKREEKDKKRKEKAEREKKKAEKRKKKAEREKKKAEKRKKKAEKRLEMERLMMRRKIISPSKLTDYCRTLTDAGFNKAWRFKNCYDDEADFVAYENAKSLELDKSCRDAHLKYLIKGTEKYDFEHWFLFYQIVKKMEKIFKKEDLKGLDLVDALGKFAKKYDRDRKYHIIEKRFRGNYTKIYCKTELDFSYLGRLLINLKNESFVPHRMRDGSGYKESERLRELANNMLQTFMELMKDEKLFGFEGFLGDMESQFMHNNSMFYIEANVIATRDLVVYHKKFSMFEAKMKMKLILSIKFDSEFFRNWRFVGDEHDIIFKEWCIYCDAPPLKKSKDPNVLNGFKPIERKIKYENFQLAKRRKREIMLFPDDLFEKIKGCKNRGFFFIRKRENPQKYADMVLDFNMIKRTNFNYFGTPKSIKRIGRKLFGPGKVKKKGEKPVNFDHPQFWKHWQKNKTDKVRKALILQARFFHHEIWDLFDEIIGEKETGVITHKEMYDRIRKTKHKPDLPQQSSNAAVIHVSLFEGREAYLFAKKFTEIRDSFNIKTARQAKDFSEMLKRCSILSLKIPKIYYPVNNKFLGIEKKLSRNEEAKTYKDSEIIFYRYSKRIKKWFDILEININDRYFRSIEMSAPLVEKWLIYYTKILKASGSNKYEKFRVVSDFFKPDHDIIFDHFTKVSSDSFIKILQNIMREITYPSRKELEKKIKKYWKKHPRRLPKISRYDILSGTTVIYASRRLEIYTDIEITQIAVQFKIIKEIPADEDILITKIRQYYKNTLAKTAGKLVGKGLLNSDIVNEIFKYDSLENSYEYQHDMLLDFIINAKKIGTPRDVLYLSYILKGCNAIPEYKKEMIYEYKDNNINYSEIIFQNKTLIDEYLRWSNSSNLTSLDIGKSLIDANWLFQNVFSVKASGLLDILDGTFIKIGNYRFEYIRFVESKMLNAWININSAIFGNINVYELNDIQSKRLVCEKYIELFGTKEFAEFAELYGEEYFIKLFGKWW